jgi:hypothetical protein
LTDSVPRPGNKFKTFRPRCFVRRAGRLDVKTSTREGLPGSSIGDYKVRIEGLSDHGDTEGNNMRGNVQLPAGFQLRIALRDILPPIWRRFVVPGAITLPRLHRVIAE